MFNFGAHGFNVKSVSPKIKHYTFSTYAPLLECDLYYNQNLWSET